MSKQRICKAIFNLRDKSENLSREELIVYINALSNQCEMDLDKISKANKRRYVANPNSKVLRTKNNARRAIRGFWNRRSDDSVRKRIKKHIETLRTIKNIKN